MAGWYVQYEHIHTTISASGQYHTAPMYQPCALVKGIQALPARETEPTTQSIHKELPIPNLYLPATQAVQYPPIWSGIPRVAETVDQGSAARGGDAQGLAGGARSRARGVLELPDPTISACFSVLARVPRIRSGLCCPQGRCLRLGSLCNRPSLSMTCTC